MIGDSWLWLCSDGPAATTTEAPDPSASPGGIAHTKSVEMLRRRRKFFVGCNVETTYDSMPKSDNVS